MKISQRNYGLSPLTYNDSPSQIALSSDPASINDIIFHSSGSSLQIYRWQILELLSNNNNTMICTDIVDAWLELLVDYTNRSTCNSLIIQTSYDSEGTDTESTKHRILDESEEGEKLYHAIPIPVADTIFRNPTLSTHHSASTYLKQHSLSPPQFLKTRTILLPLDIPIGGLAGHSILISIHPQRRVISLHDSWRPKRRSRARRIVGELVWFLESYLGAFWKPEEWMVRIAKGPWQRNKVDCGIWVCINAWDIVMGMRDGVDFMKESLQSKDDVGRMRRRMFVDILRGSISDEMESPMLLLEKNADNEGRSGKFVESTPDMFTKKNIWRYTCARPLLRDIWQTISRARKALLSGVLPLCLRSTALLGKPYEKLQTRRGG